MKITRIGLNRILLVAICMAFLCQFKIGNVLAEVTLVAPANYSKTTLAVGDEYYMDRTYSVNTQPSGFENFTAIKTKNDDKNVTDSTHIILNLSQNSTVYVAYDQRATALPGWLGVFTATGQLVESQGDSSMGYFNLYAKDYPAGQLTLGGNKCCGAAGAGSNYIVYVDEGLVAADLSVNPTELFLSPGDNDTVAISGGIGPYFLSDPGDPTVVTAILSDSTLSVEALAVDYTFITISDSASNSIMVPVTVSNNFVVNPTDLTLSIGGIGTASIGGGTSPYAVFSIDPSVATVEIEPATVDTLSIIGVSVGSTTIYVGDSAIPVAGMGTIVVTVVAPLSVSPGVLYMDIGETGTFTVSGGSGIYSVISGNESVATASLNGDVVTVNAISAGSISVTVSDTSGQIQTVIVNSGGAASPGLGNCPNPPFISGSSVSPNILLILDHSGSMGNGDGSKWEIAKSVLKSIIAEFPNLRMGLMRMDGSNYYGDEHWYSSSKVVRQGGKILKPCGTSAGEINSYIDGWQYSNDPQTWTNLAETLVSAGRYFATVINVDGNRDGAGPQTFGFYEKAYHYSISTNIYDATITDDKGNLIDTISPIQYYCQNSYVIFITDGLANYDNDWDLVADVIGDYDNDSDSGDCKNGDTGCTGEGEYFDDVAKYLYEKDMRNDLEGTQNITTYVVGFQIDDPLLSSAAANGGGEYYTADNADGLTMALKSAIKDITDKESSGTAVSTISTSSETDDYLIRARFKPLSQVGFLEAFTLPYSDGDTPYWEAGEKLQQKIVADGHSSRNIYTCISTEATKKQPFVDTNPKVWDILDDTWGEVEAETLDVMNYIRGDATYDGIKYRNRKGWFLGDIIYSTPVSVGPPKYYYTENNYQSFKASNYSRTHMVYIGANDGMLHAFNAADGTEEWAFIPENIQSKLINLTLEDCHNYYVDLTPYVTDIWDGTNWRTVLIGGNRLGGEGYFCLDVTDPAHDQFSILWDIIPFSHAKSSTIPVAGKIKGDGIDQWVAIITSGYSEEVAIEGKIAVVDLSDGTKLGEITTQVKGASSPYYSLTSPVALDSDLDGYLDLLYVGDTEGSVWKFYYDYEDDVWQKVQLFQTGGQPITSKLTIALGEDGKLQIYFGTGKYLVEGDKFDSVQNAFYCIVEHKVTTEDLNNGHYTSETIINKLSDLVDVTSVLTDDEYINLSSDQQDKINDYGWYFQLDTPLGPSERIIAEAAVISGNVFFTSFVPNQDVCGFGGASRLYAVNFQHGTIAMIGDDPALTGEAGFSRFKDLGSGLPSKPVYYFDPATKKTKLIVQTSDTTVHFVDVNTEERPMVINSWKTVTD